MSLIFTSYLFFFFNDTATTEIYTLSLHDALPISLERRDAGDRRAPGALRRGGGAAAPRAGSRAARGVVRETVGGRPGLSHGAGRAAAVHGRRYLAPPRAAAAHRHGARGGAGGSRERLDPTGDGDVLGAPGAAARARRAGCARGRLRAREPHAHHVERDRERR